MKNTLRVTTPSDREIVLTRPFDAPRHLVYEAFSRPEFLKRWLLGPPGWEMVVCEVDLKVGGKYRFTWRNADGSEMAMHGVYREIVPHERTVTTESFDFGCDTQSGQQLVSSVLADQGDRTILTTTIRYPSKEARDATIRSGMERGVAASYDRLEDILASVPAKAKSQGGDS